MVCGHINETPPSYKERTMENVQEYTLQKMWVSGYYYLLGMSNKRRSYGDGEIDGSEQMTMNMNMNAVKRNSNQT